MDHKLQMARIQGESQRHIRQLQYDQQKLDNKLELVKENNLHKLKLVATKSDAEVHKLHELGRQSEARMKNLLQIQ